MFFLIGIKSLPGFLIPVSLQPDCLNLRYFKLFIIWTNMIHSLKYLRSLVLDCIDRGFRKLELHCRDPRPISFNKGCFQQNSLFSDCQSSFWFLLSVCYKRSTSATSCSTLPSRSSPSHTFQ